MTEEEWLTGTDARPMLRFLGNRPKLRKPRLFAVACCRRIWSRFPDDSRFAVDAAEQLADGQLSEQDWKRAAKTAHNATVRIGSFNAAMAAVIAVSRARSREDAAQLSRNTAETVLCALECSENPLLVSAEREAQAALIHDIFGNPFRPVTFSPAWRTDTAITLARQMYESRDFGAMPILADALQDAGCDNEDMLNHCRDANQPHVRGCWVVDLVLGLS